MNLFVKCFIFLSIIILLTKSAGAGESGAAVPGRWTVEKAGQWYAKQPWLIGTNFTPSSAINQLEMWQPETFNIEIISRELGWSAKMGMNTHRVFLHDLLWQQDSEGFLKRIEQFLSVADKNKIKIMFVLCDSVWNPHPTLGVQPDPNPHVHNSGWVQSPHIDILTDIKKQNKLESYYKGIIGRFKNDSHVLIWDLYNEPGNRNSEDGITVKEKEDIGLIMLRKMFAWAREINPSQPLTAGVWMNEWIGPKATDINRFMLANSDIITFHGYHSLDRMKERVGSIKPFGRPLICMEYMARTADSTFKEHLPYFKANKIGAYNWGFVAGKTQTQYPWESWEKEYTAEPEVWFHDILRPDGTAYDQDEVDYIKSIIVEK